MKDKSHHLSDGHSAEDGGDFGSWPDGDWHLKDPRSCYESDSCGCYVDPCAYFGVSSEDGCIDVDILCGN